MHVLLKGISSFCTYCWSMPQIFILLVILGIQCKIKKIGIMLCGIALGNTILGVLIPELVCPFLPTQISLWSPKTLHVIFSCLHGLELIGNALLLYWCWKRYYTPHTSSGKSILKRTVLLALCLNAPYLFAYVIAPDFLPIMPFGLLSLLVFLGAVCGIVLCLKLLCWTLNRIKEYPWQESCVGTLNLALMLGCSWVIVTGILNLCWIPYKAWYTPVPDHIVRKTMFQFPLWSITQRTITPPNKNPSYAVIFTSLFSKVTRLEYKENDASKKQERFESSFSLGVKD